MADYILSGMLASAVVKALLIGGCGAGAGVADASRGCRLRHLGHGRRAPSQQVETGMYVKTLTVDLACHASM